MHINIFPVIKFVTFGMLDPILCLMCNLLIISEDCLIKLILLSLQCCYDSLLLLFCWAYVSGYMPFMSSEYVHVLYSYSLNVACVKDQLQGISNTVLLFISLRCWPHRERRGSGQNQTN